MNQDKKMKLGFSMRGLGYHGSAWMDPDVPADGPISVPYYVDMAQTAERGLFDMIFLADQTAIDLADVPKGAFGHVAEGGEFEPLTLLAALSMVTKHIGLVATASTTFHHPYQLARQFASIDHLSGGRAGWNVVTSSRDDEARNFGDDKILEKTARYERAREAVEIAFGLWESWEEDAFPRDKKTGVFFDPAKMHPIKHRGEYFKVHGPLTTPRSPQGRPLIIQAGASDDGMGLAAAIADVVYAAQNTLEDAQAFYAKVKARVASIGRDPDHVKIMPGILPIIGATMEEAQARYRRMQEELDPITGMANLSRYFGDLSIHDLDGPVPELRTDRPVISRGAMQLAMARRNNWTIRQMYQSTAIGNAHHVVVGTPAHIVDVMETWFFNGAADGFNVLPHKSPAGIREFVADIVPEMQRRGLFRTAYEGRTMRENLGLPPVVSPWASAHQA
ncbi:LLM class flavin-dependent oxidoreductase [Humitalea sp. 24SJ18S-53]|uniref:LLM class flavin-dependent oxidoreductase n=1 Tax=Humitalea sp. 24SJ18S-53 TaxID=3422307 RepID=UPI003D666B8D